MRVSSGSSISPGLIRRNSSFAKQGGKVQVNFLTLCKRIRGPRVSSRWESVDMCWSASSKQVGLDGSRRHEGGKARLPRLVTDVLVAAKPVQSIVPMVALDSV